MLRGKKKNNKMPKRVRYNDVGPLVNAHGAVYLDKDTELFAPSKLGVCMLLMWSRAEAADLLFGGEPPKGVDKKTGKEMTSYQWW